MPFCLNGVQTNRPPLYVDVILTPQVPLLLVPSSQPPLEFRLRLVFHCSFDVSPSQVYLTREGTELILNYGPRLMCTVLTRPCHRRGCNWINYRVGAPGRRICSDHRVREVGLIGRPNHLSDRRRIVGMAPGSVRKTHESNLPRQLEEMVHDHLPWPRQAHAHPPRPRARGPDADGEFFFEQSIDKMPGQLEKMNEIAAVHDIQGFKHDPTLVKTHAVNQEAGVVDSYRHLAPVIDTDQPRSTARPHSGFDNRQPEIVRMRDRCNKFVPGLENAELDPVPFVQGLRPFRDTNVRVEQEQRLKSDGMHSRIIHS
ncbi:hypothetical protein BD779DRAFT_1805140 [Infundibulicybe gibba]|nr:hypothetical protein BD779DRAFT_1805140 [Infundibulicybe gibba]